MVPLVLTYGHVGYKGVGLADPQLKIPQPANPCLLCEAFQAFVTGSFRSNPQMSRLRGRCPVVFGQFGDTSKALPFTDVLRCSNALTVRIFSDGS